MGATTTGKGRDEQAQLDADGDQDTSGGWIFQGGHLDPRMSDRGVLRVRDGD